MIQAFVSRRGMIERIEIGSAAILPAEALWIDILDPTAEERTRVEAAFGIALPTHDEMREIEPSSRLYYENGAAFMTATVLAQADTTHPTSDVITFILARRMLITLRYTAPRPFSIYATKLCRTPAESVSGGEDVLFGLLEAFVDRIADVLERIGIDLDRVSKEIFQAGSPSSETQDLQNVIRALGRNEDLASSSRESLLSLTRIVRFHAATFETESKKETKEVKTRVRSLQRDIDSLNEHVAYESHKINFLLDATLGMVNIEQNRIIKIFSVAAVVFLPPTLVASVYGMNFEFMPELHWEYGYIVALSLMILSAVLPILYFRKRKWL